MTLPGADTCQPVMRPFPSGVAWAHGDGCRRYKGQKISPAAPWHDGDGKVCEYGRRSCRPMWSTELRHLVHAEDCPVRPGELITTREYAKGRRVPAGGWPRRVIR